MADSLHFILDYLRENNFTRAQEVLITELQTKGINVVDSSVLSSSNKVENVVDERDLRNGSSYMDHFKDLNLNSDPQSRKSRDGSLYTSEFREWDSSSGCQLENSRDESSYKDEFRASEFSSNPPSTNSRDESSYKDHFKALTLSLDARPKHLRDGSSYKDSFISLDLSLDSKPKHSREGSSYGDYSKNLNLSLDPQSSKSKDEFSYKDEFRDLSLSSDSQLTNLRGGSSYLNNFRALNLSLATQPINRRDVSSNKDYFRVSSVQLDPQLVKSRPGSSYKDEIRDLSSSLDSQLIKSNDGSSYIDNFSYLSLTSDRHMERLRDRSSYNDEFREFKLSLDPQVPKTVDGTSYIDQFRALSLRSSFETNESHISGSASRENLTDDRSRLELNSENISTFREWTKEQDMENIQGEKEGVTLGSDAFDNSVFSHQSSQLSQHNALSRTSKANKRQNRLQKQHKYTYGDQRTIERQTSTSICEIDWHAEKLLSQNRSAYLQHPKYDKVQDVNLQSFSAFACNAPIDNGWMNFGFPLDGVFKEPIMSHSHLLPSAMDDNTGVMFNQQGEGIDCIDFLKRNRKGRENIGDDFVKDLTLPWELRIPNNFGEGEIFVSESQTEEFSNEYPAKLRSANKDLYLTKDNDEGFDFDRMLHDNNQGCGHTAFEQGFNLGSFLDVPIGQGRSLTGDKCDNRINGLLPVSQSIMQDTPELLSGFATLEDDLTGSGIGYPKDDWDSDTYDDDEDPGYHRQPIEDEAWFLAHEIEYPSEDDRLTSNNQKEVIYPLQDGTNEIIGDPLHVEGSYLSGKQLYNMVENLGQAVSDHDIRDETNLFSKSSLKDTLKQIGSINYDGQLMDSEELKSIGTGQVWQGFNSQTGEDLLSGENKHSELACRHPHANVNTAFIKNGHPGLNIYEETGNKVYHEPGEFSFPSPSSTDIPLSQHMNHYDIQTSTKIDALACGQESQVSSSTSSPKFMSCPDVVPSNKMSAGMEHESFVPRDETMVSNANEKDDVSVTGMDDGDTAILQEELEQMKVQEDFEIFTLRIVHRKNRTGFEEEKDFPIVLNSVVAGRYLLTEYLGSAAFSRAVKARDLQTGVDVCMKIVKNNKDFFDQSLDEIKLLKYINIHDPADSHHLLRLFDYFYYREHLFLVCELLRANLYEFQKFNRESGREMYFTMPRLQSITRQCLEALEFLHGLGLIHCDLKPENILMKSYSRCEIKVIDLGSSCFQTDHLCSYVQSRSYRAPEVILGLPYDQKIDIWSLGCILAELCSGNVLFQNDSLATLLARVVGIIGPIVPDMILRGREAHKYFTKNFMLYDRNQATNMLEYVVPKKTSLRHRIPAGDQGFVDFVAYLLQIHPENRPTASEALKHPWLTYPYGPILT